VALILDTNALSAFADGDARLLRLLGAETQPAIPVVVLGEYLYGIYQSRHRATYQAWLDANLSVFDLLGVGRHTARQYAEIRRELKAGGHPIPSNDVWIAALAREHRMPVVTRDRHFSAVPGLRLLSW
jgi:predicted nucleic acid-binding protein